MCTLLFRHCPGDIYPIAILANRDEFYKRPSEGWAWRSRRPRYFAPKDLEGGGTWIGFNEHGVVTALTNIFPGRRDAGFRSRGALVTDALGLARAEQAPGLLNQLTATHPFNNFNLLVADKFKAYLFTWLGSDWDQHDLAPGAYEVVNRHFDGTRLSAGSETNEVWMASQSSRLLKHPNVCRHGGAYGTRCSHRLLIHGTKPRRSNVWHLEGHPCQGSYELVLAPSIKHEELHAK